VTPHTFGKHQTDRRAYLSEDLWYCFFKAGPLFSPHEGS